MAGASVAPAWHVSGKVVCDANGDGQIDAADTAVVGVMVAVENSSGSFTATATTAANGTFTIDLPHTADSYLAYLHPPTVPPGASVLRPAGGVHSFSLTFSQESFEQANFLLDCDTNEPPPPPADAECDKVTGGGWIVGTPSGAKGNFGVSGGTKGGEFWGHLNYVDHGTGMHVRSTAVTAYQLDPANANGRYIHFNVLIGSASGTAVVHVIDNGEPGTRDVFGITLSNGYAAHGELGGTEKKGGGGNIQLHTCPPGKRR